MIQQGKKKELQIKIKNVTNLNHTNKKLTCENSDLIIIHTEWNDFKSID